MSVRFSRIDTDGDGFGDLIQPDDYDSDGCLNMKIDADNDY